MSWWCRIQSSSGCICQSPWRRSCRHHTILIEGNDINIIYIQPGHPTQNSIIERFNGSYRRAVLDAYIFRTLHDVRELTEAWMTDYNECRPHESLDNMTPMEYREKKKVG